MLPSAGYTHGYDLKQAIHQRFGSAWAAVNVDQIYTTLSRLERDGLVVSQEVEQSDMPNERVYEITGEGRVELENWVSDSTGSPRLRDEFFVKLVLAQVAGIAEPTDLIARQRHTPAAALPSGPQGPRPGGREGRRRWHRTAPRGGERCSTCRRI